MNTYSLKLPKGIYIGSLIFSVIGLFIIAMGEEVVLGLIALLFFGGAGGFTFYLQGSKKPILVVNEKEVKYGMLKSVIIPIERIYDVAIKGIGKDKLLQVQYSKEGKITILKIMNNLNKQPEEVAGIIQNYMEQCTVDFDFTSADNYAKTAKNSNYQNELKSSWLMTFTYLFIFLVLYLSQSGKGFIPLSFILVGVMFLIDIGIAIFFIKEEISFKIRLKIYLVMYSLSMLYLIYTVLSIFDILWFNMVET